MLPPITPGFTMTDSAGLPTVPTRPIANCPVCGAKFATPVALNDHILAVHPTPPTCQSKDGLPAQLPSDTNPNHIQAANSQLGHHPPVSVSVCNSYPLSQPAPAAGFLHANPLAPSASSVFSPLTCAISSKAPPDDFVHLIPADDQVFHMPKLNGPTAAEVTTHLKPTYAFCSASFSADYGFSRSTLPISVSWDFIYTNRHKHNTVKSKLAVRGKKDLVPNWMTTQAVFRGTDYSEEEHITRVLHSLNPNLHVATDDRTQFFNACSTGLKNDLSLQVKNQFDEFVREHFDKLLKSIMAHAPAAVQGTAIGSMLSIVAVRRFCRNNPKFLHVLCHAEETIKQQFQQNKLRVNLWLLSGRQINISVAGNTHNRATFLSAIVTDTIANKMRQTQTRLRDFLKKSRTTLPADCGLMAPFSANEHTEASISTSAADKSLASLPTIHTSPDGQPATATRFPPAAGPVSGPPCAASPSTHFTLSNVHNSHQQCSFQEAINHVDDIVGHEANFIFDSSSTSTAAAGGLAAAPAEASSTLQPSSGTGATGSMQAEPLAAFHASTLNSQQPANSSSVSGSKHSKEPTTTTRHSMASDHPVAPLPTSNVVSNSSPKKSKTKTKTTMEAASKNSTAKKRTAASPAATKATGGPSDTPDGACQDTPMCANPKHRASTLTTQRTAGRNPKHAYFEDFKRSFDPNCFCPEVYNLGFLKCVANGPHCITRLVDCYNDIHSNHWKSAHYCNMCANALSEGRLESRTLITTWCYSCMQDYESGVKLPNHHKLSAVHNPADKRRRSRRRR